MMLKLLLATISITLGHAAASSCKYVQNISYEGGNMTCPGSAPVLFSLETIAPEGIAPHLLPSTNWTILCDCPGWSLTNTEDTFSEWISYDVLSRHTGVSWIRCSLNQYLSGLAFAKDPTADVYVWSARCTNLPVGYTKRELFCWNSNATLVQGSNGSLSLPGESVVIERIKISYEDYYVNNFYHTRFNYVFCLVIDVECPNPHVTNGYSDLSPPAADNEYLIGAINLFSKKYNESLQIYCHDGYYMEGPNVASCQANGEWSQLPICRACKSIRYCKTHSCIDGTSSLCVKCKPYTRTGYQVAINHNRKKCRVVPYIHRKEITLFFIYELGETIRMDCPAYGIPAPTIVWSSITLNRSVADVISTSRLHFFENGSLEISNLTALDEALYSCSAINSVGVDTIHILVVNELLVNFNLTSAAPQINQSNIILFFDANKQAMLHCVASGAPTPQIRWYKLDNDRQYSVPPYNNLRIKKLPNGSLSFAPIRRHDWGRYACEAVNDYGHDVANWIVCVGNSCGGTFSGGIIAPPPFLFVEYAPIIIQWKKIHIVREGNPFSVSCIAGGNPPPLMEWRRGNDIISENGTLNLQQVSVHDTGIYSCAARNRAGVTTREMAVITDKRATGI